jgi:hypothetical protein
MADPVSISASIITILELSKRVLNYLNGVKGASDDRRRLLSEVASISGLLYHLKDRAEQTQRSYSLLKTLQSLEGPKGPLESLDLTLKTLESKLTPAEGWKTVKRAIDWPFQKEEIKEILQRIERYKSLFSLALQNDHL